MSDLSLNQQATKIAAKINVSTKTVRRWLTGGNVLPVIAAACERAAEELGIERAEREAS